MKTRFISVLVLVAGVVLLGCLSTGSSSFGWDTLAPAFLPTTLAGSDADSRADVLASSHMLGSVAQTGTVWYVATSGDDNNHCRTPGEPCRTIHAAINKASDGDTIYIVGGVYFETISTDKNLTLEGEQAALTIIDGQGQGHVLHIESSTVTVSNLTIQNGYAIYGGGVFNNGTLNVTNSIIANNTATGWGGGIYSSGMLSVTNSTLSGNYAGQHGGAVYVSFHGTGLVHIVGNIISNNSVGGLWGGAIYGHLGSGHNVTDNCIIGNSDVSVATHIEGGAPNFSSNWWGAEDGPAVLIRDYETDNWKNLGGSGDSVDYGLIDYEPWLTTPPFPCVTNKPAIVFVHGWHGWPPWAECDPVDPGAYFQDVDDALKDAGYHIEYARLVSTPCYTPPIAENTTWLKAAIERAKSRTGQDKVILVAHSMGGLVSRAYIESPDYEDDVSTLFTFGTPHQGVPVEVLVFLGGGGPLAAWCAIQQPVACQMSHLGIWLFNKIYSTRAKDVTYHLISGDAPFWSRYGWGKATCLFGSNDGIVPTSSGLELLGVFDHWQTDEVHAEVFGPRTYFIRDGELSSSYYQCLEPILVGDASACGSSLSLSTRAEDANALAQRTPFQYGTLLAEQTITRTISLESDAALFSSQWQTGAVTVTLVDPNDQVIDPTYAASNPDVVTYDADETVATYYFTHTIAGDWQLVLRAGSDVPAEGSNYTTFAAFDSPVSLMAGTDRYWYLPGTVATITATLSGSPSSVAVTATILRTDDATETVSLAPIGGDEYWASYTVPNVPGYTEVSLVAAGATQEGYSFERGEDLLFQISPGSVVLNGSYSDSPQLGSSGVPRYEALLVTVGVNSTINGTVGLSADLTVEDGHFVAHSSTIEDVSIGTGFLTLRFDGDDIYASQRNGPYTLTNLLLTERISATLAVTETQHIYTTGVYDYHDFGFDTIFLPILMKDYTSPLLPSPPEVDVTINQAFVTDYSWLSPRDTFCPGEAIVLAVLAVNHTGETVPVTYTWGTYDPNGTKVDALSWDSWPVSMAPGAEQWSLERGIPADAIAGTYTYEATLSHDSNTMTSNTRFIVGGSPISITLLEAVTAKDVNEAYKPVDVTDTFSTDDEYVYSWTAWEGASGDHTIRWKWYRPNDSLFLDYGYSFGGTQSLRSLWASISVPEMGGDLGEWHVDIYVDDYWWEELYFSLEAGTLSRMSAESGASRVIGDGAALLPMKRPVPGPIRARPD